MRQHQRPFPPQPLGQSATKIGFSTTEMWLNSTVPSLQIGSSPGGAARVAPTIVSPSCA